MAQRSTNQAWSVVAFVICPALADDRARKSLAVTPDHSVKKSRRKSMAWEEGISSSQAPLMQHTLFKVWCK